jgi:hypothetical protein
VQVFHRSFALLLLGEKGNHVLRDEILRFAQNDKRGVGPRSSTASLLTFFRSFTAFRMTKGGIVLGFNVGIARLFVF